MDYNQQQVTPEYYYQQYQQYPQYQSVPQNYEYYNQYATQQYPVQEVIPEQQAVELQKKSSLKSWFDFTDKNYIKGLLTGAGVAVVLGHPKVRKAIISGAVSTWDAVSCGFEELKEQVEDVRAEKGDKED